MGQPLVSLIVGSYNRVAYLREAIDSMLNQTYPNKEVIVVDDASRDGTVGVLEEYGDRIRLIRRTTNSGVCGVTKNDGMREARGEYFAFQDSDDIWYPTKIEKQVALMESRADVPLSHTYCHVIDQDSRVLRVRHEGSLPPTGRIFETLLKHCFITISTVMVRRTLIDELGGFASDPVWGRASEDHHFFLRVARKYPIGMVDEVLSAYRVGSAGSMAAVKGWKEAPEVLPFIARFLEHPELWEGTVSRHQVVDALLSVCRENRQFWQDQGFADRGMYFAWEAFKRRPWSIAVASDLAKSMARFAITRGPNPGATAPARGA